MRKYGFFASGLVFLLLFGFKSAFSAVYKPEVEAKDNTYSIPLAWLNAKDASPLELYGASPRISLDLPISSRLKINKAKLDVVYTNSISLIPRSLLAISLDKSILGQMPLKADSPDNAVRLQLPVNDLTAGFHKIGFRAAQHYTNECEDSSAPELFSQINTRSSILELDAVLRPIQPKLDQLDKIYDRRLWIDKYELNFYIPMNAQSDSSVQEAAAQVSQAIAGFLQYIPVQVKINTPQEDSSIDPRPSYRFKGFSLPKINGLNNLDGVLVGTRAQLRPYISDKLYKKIVDGFIGIYQSDDDPDRTILVVSGDTSAQLLAAASALNLPGVAFPDSNHVLVSKLVMPTGYHTNQRVIDDPGWTSFANLGFDNETLQGRYPKPAEVNFWVGDKIYMLNPSAPYVSLDLHVAYGSGFDQKSGLNVFLNNQLIKTIPLTDPSGEQIFKYKIRLPTPSIQNGFNQIKLQPTVIGKDVGGKCRPMFYDNLFVSVFADSRINLPHSSESMVLPDLGLFSRTGLPYTKKMNGSKIGVLLSDSSSSSLGPALTLISKLRQVSTKPLLDLNFFSDFNDAGKYKSLLVVGDESALPVKLREEVPEFMSNQNWQSFDFGNTKALDLKKGFWDWLKNPTGSVLSKSESSKHAFASLSLKQGIGDSTAMIQYNSPSLKIPVTLLTAGTKSNLINGADELVNDTLWNKLSGAATLWNANAKVVANVEPKSRLYYGDKPVLSTSTLVLSNHPWLSLVSVLIFLFGFAGLTWWLLRKRANKLGVDD